MDKIGFPEWLTSEIEKRGLTKAEFAKQSGLSASHITRITNGEQTPGSDTIVEIARVLNLPPEDVFRRVVGIKSRGEDEEIGQLAYRISKLPAEDQQIIDDLIQAMLSRRGIFTNEKNNTSNSAAPSAQQI